ncbi:MAG: TetR/AcrR family transcriptional regulator [Solirubrobacteraceae bacterium]
MSNDPPRFPNRRAAAERNREKIVAAAREAFGAADGEVSMAQVARQAGVGMATLYRNFPGRTELYEAVYVDEVDALCAAARNDADGTPGDALDAWLRRFFAFIPTKRLLVTELLQGSGTADPVITGNRERLLEAGEPLLHAAQRSGEIRGDLDLVQVLDLVVAIARVPGDRAHVEPMLQVVLDGLRTSP